MMSQVNQSQSFEIEFHCPDHVKDVFPPPVPAAKCIPEYYKNLVPQIDDHPKSGTAKRCIPFLEAITSGFIIPLWSDMYMSCHDGEISVDFPNNYPMEESFGFHGYEQLKDNPLAESGEGKALMKFINPWVIRTPKGVSCLFTMPLNHMEKRFKLIDGIVDTDTYYNQINFPFVWTGGDGNHFVERGTPLVHVIPFVRTSFTMSTGVMEEAANSRVRSKLGTALKNGYKRFFWHKGKQDQEE